METKKMYRSFAPAAKNVKKFSQL